MQAACMFFFACAETELQTIAEDFLPPGVPVKVFLRKLQAILSEDFAFVTYNKRSPWPERWRRGLAHVIDFGVTYDTAGEPIVQKDAKRLKVIEK